MKATGLHCAQIFEGYNFEVGTENNVVLNNAAPAAPNVVTSMAIVNDGSDDRVFLENGIVNVRCFNNSNYPVLVRLVYYVTRKDIGAQLYPDVASLVVDGTPALSVLGHGDPLTSNALQRFVKFVKLKKKVLYGGKMMMWKCKARGQRMITGDYEGSPTNYTLVKGTRGVMAFIDGIPVEGSGAGDGLVAAGPISVQITHAHKCTWRVPEDNSSTSVVSQAFPNLDGFADIVVPDTEAEPLTQA